MLLLIIKIFEIVKDDDDISDHDAEIEPVITNKKPSKTKNSVSKSLSHSDKLYDENEQDYYRDHGQKELKKETILSNEKPQNHEKRKKKRIKG